MKKLSSLVAVLLLALSFKSTALAPGGVVTTAFWLDVNVVNQIAASGATTLKVYAGTDASGSPCYLMVGGDAGYTTMAGNVFRQSSRGVCPPSCEFTSVDLGEGTNGYIDAGEAGENIDRYRQMNSGAKNCARFTLSSLSAIRSSSAYIKVFIGTSATASGLTAAGEPSGKSNALGTAVTTGL